jgi:hypothetical protein
LALGYQVGRINPGNGGRVSLKHPRAKRFGPIRKQQAGGDPTGLLSSGWDVNDGSMGLRLRDRYREWNRYSYLSRFERRLNRTLWAVLLLGVAYAVLQHVVLANVPEVFRAGARWGDLFYDLAIAYVGAFAFYVLNIRLPLRRDRRHIYQNIAPLINRIVALAVDFVWQLNRTAAVPESRPNTLDNILDTCGRITLDTETPNFGIPNPDGSLRQGTVRELIRDSVAHAQKVNKEVLEFAPYLAAEMIENIVGIEQRGYFGVFALVDHALGDERRTRNLSFLARHIFDYLQLADKVDDYYTEFVHAFVFSGSFLVSGTRDGSDAVPLESRRAK